MTTRRALFTLLTLFTLGLAHTAQATDYIFFVQARTADEALFGTQPGPRFNNPSRSGQDGIRIERLEVDHLSDFGTELSHTLKDGDRVLGVILSGHGNQWGMSLSNTDQTQTSFGAKEVDGAILAPLFENPSRLGRTFYLHAFGCQTACDPHHGTFFRELSAAVEDRMKNSPVEHSEIVGHIGYSGSFAYSPLHDNVIMRVISRTLGRGLAEFDRLTYALKLKLPYQVQLAAHQGAKMLNGLGMLAVFALMKEIPDGLIHTLAMSTLGAYAINQFVGYSYPLVHVQTLGTDRPDEKASLHLNQTVSSRLRHYLKLAASCNTALKS